MVAAAVVPVVLEAVATALQRVVVVVAVVGLQTESEVVVAAEQIVEAVVEAVET